MSKHRTWQFTLRAALVGMLVLSVVLARWANNVRWQERVAVTILAEGGQVRYTYQENGRFDPESKPPGPDWLRNLLGEHYFVTISRVHLRGPVEDRRLIADVGALPLTALALESTDISETELAHLHRLRSLRRVVVADQPLSVADLQWLGSNTEVSNRCFDQLRRYSNLRGLDLEGTQVERVGAQQLAADLLKLDELFLPDPAAGP